jgi:preprotein translocase SecE subunit
MKSLNRLKKFLKEVWLEAKPGGRVNWPSSKKLIESTVLVLVCALFFMIYIGLLDFVVRRVFSYLINVF